MSLYKYFHVWAWNSRCVHEVVCCINWTTGIGYLWIISLKTLFAPHVYKLYCLFSQMGLIFCSLWCFYKKPAKNIKKLVLICKLLLHFISASSWKTMRNTPLTPKSIFFILPKGQSLNNFNSKQWIHITS